MIQSPVGINTLDHQLLSTKQVDQQTATLLLCGADPANIAALTAAAAAAVSGASGGSPPGPTTLQAARLIQAEDEEQKRRRLARRPSYRKILDDISSTDGVGVECLDTDEDSVDNSTGTTITRLVSAPGISGSGSTPATIQLSSSYLKVLQPGSAIQLTSAAAAAAAAATAAAVASATTASTSTSSSTSSFGTAQTGGAESSSVVVTSQHDAVMNSAAAAAAAAAAQGSTIVHYAGHDGQFSLPSESHYRFSLPISPHREKKLPLIFVLLFNFKRLS